jgi:hypothetical protein
MGETNDAVEYDEVNIFRHLFVRSTLLISFGGSPQTGSFTSTLQVVRSKTE